MPSGEKTKNTYTLASPGGLLAAALGTGAAWQFFLPEKRLGIGFPLWMGSALAAALVVAYRENRHAIRWRQTLLLGGAILFFATMIAVRANSFLTVVNFGACAGLSALWLRFLTRDELFQISGRTLFGASWTNLGHAFVGAGPVLKAFNERLPSRAEQGQRAVPILRGLLFALPVLAVFIALLYSADALFARGVAQAAEWLFPADFAERLMRIATTLGIAWVTAGKIAHAVSGDGKATDTDTPNRSYPLGFTEGMIVLGSVTFVFIAFVAIQFTYLFGGSDRVMSVPGLTYAEYAHRGFGELIAVACLTVALIEGMRAALRRGTAGQDSAFRTNATLLVGLTLVILASAYQRMAVYECAYGATDTRLYVDTFLICLGVTLAYLAVTLWARPRRLPSFPAGMLACAVAFAATINLQNAEATSIAVNVRRAASAGKTNLSFGVNEHSDDAIPELLRAYDAAGSEASRAAIGRGLHSDWERLSRWHREDRWPAFHVGRERAYRLLSARQSELVRYPEACNSCE